MTAQGLTLTYTRDPVTGQLAWTATEGASSPSGAPGWWRTTGSITDLAGEPAPVVVPGALVPQTAAANSGGLTTVLAGSGQLPAFFLTPGGIQAKSSLTGALSLGANGGIPAVASSALTPSAIAPAGFPNVPALWAPCCFAAGTPVKTETGHAPIESLKVGDLVQSEDPKTGAISLRLVTQVHVRPIEKINTFYKLTVSKDGAEEDFYVTGEHPFWIADKAEWRSVEELSVGDALADFGGHRLRVFAKAPVSEKQQTYNISVEGNATYFAGRSEVLVHNNNCGNLPVGYAINADGTVTTPAPGEALLGLRAQVPAGYPDPTLIPGYAVLERLTPSGSPTGQFLTFTSNAAGDALVNSPLPRQNTQTWVGQRPPYHSI